MQTIQGKIVKFMPKQEGESARGHWVKAGVVIEYGGEYLKKAAFSLFGEERLQMCKGLNPGMEVKIDYNPESREYQERWYTDLNCVRIENVVHGNTDSTANTPTMAPDTTYPSTLKQEQQNTQSNKMQVDDELPF